MNDIKHHCGDLNQLKSVECEKFLGYWRCFRLNQLIIILVGCLPSSFQRHQYVDNVTALNNAHVSHQVRWVKRDEHLIVAKDKSLIMVDIGGVCQMMLKDHFADNEIDLDQFTQCRFDVRERVPRCNFDRYIYNRDISLPQHGSDRQISGRNHNSLGDGGGCARRRKRGKALPHKSGQHENPHDNQADTKYGYDDSISNSGVQYALLGNEVNSIQMIRLWVIPNHCLLGAV